MAAASPPRVVVCAPNAFKGALSAADAAAAMAAGVLDAGLPWVVPVEVPVADGGDGTLDVLLAASPGPRVDVVPVTGPLGARVEARLGWLDAHTAVVELAEASGLRLVPPGAESPLRATTRGGGELILAALDGGARRVVVGVGGSATTDGGAGAADALGARLLDAHSQPLAPGGAALRDLASVDLTALDPRLAEVRLEVAVDVRSPLLGSHGAAAVFGPQKGASPRDVGTLDAALLHYVSVVSHTLGIPAARAQEPGMGAAGGCAYGLAVLCGATLVAGAALVCDLVRLDAALAGAALVLTGEGRLDPSTDAGKAPAEVAARAAAAGLPCVALAGSVDSPSPAYAEAIAIGAGLPLEESKRRTAELLRAATTEVIRRRLASG